MIVVVGFDQEVETAVFGAGGIVEAARSGLIVAIGSTVAPAYARRLAERLAAKGIILLDAPLARGEAAAIAGKLLLFGAGDEAGIRGLPAGFQRLCLGYLSPGRAPAPGRSARW